jgi:subtilisin family serine protease
MRRKRLQALAAAAAAAAACLVLASAAAAAVTDRQVVAGPAEAVPGELVVGYEPDASASEQAAARRDAGVRPLRNLAPGIQLVQVEEGTAAATALAELREDVDVRQASRNWLRRPSATPDDPLFAQLWGLHNSGQPIGQKNAISGTPDADIDAPAAWDVHLGWGPGAEPVVAVMDTGVDLGHRDLATQLWANPGELAGNGIDDDGNGYADDVHGYDFAGASVIDPLDRDPNPDDPDGHGTHVSGTILAQGNDGEGIVGVAPGAKLMALKVCAIDEEEEASCPLAAMVEAYAYAIENGARVLNGSLGGSGFAAAEVALLRSNPQVLFVFAAGNEENDNDSEPSYPCALDELPAYSAENLICVAATDLDDGLAGFSNYGAESVDLGAPGVKTLSTYPEALVDTAKFLPYFFMAGTSMAAPHVTGAAGLLFAASPASTPAEAKAALMGSVDPRPALAGKTVSGGRLNLARALAQLLSGPEPEEEGEPEGGEGAPAPGPVEQLPPGPAPPDAAQPRAPIAAQPLPRAFFRRRPGRVVRTPGRRATVSFRFGAEPRGTGFACSIDGRARRTCGERLRRSFALGRHLVRVWAHDAGGELGPAAAHRFQVKQVSP